VIGFSSTSSDYERDQWAVFAEFYVPLADKLDLQLAGRYDDYDDFGSDFNPKVALRYQLMDEFILRANWSTSFRAPSLAQSGAGTLLSSYTVDCQVTPGACGGDVNGDGANLLSEDLGNPELEAEDATSWGFGFLLRPNDDIEINLDYWNIEHENLVGIDEDDFIRRALNGEFPSAADGQLPSGSPGIELRNGFVTDAHFPLTNLGWQKTDGVDLAYTQYLDTDLGSVTLMFDATYIMEFDRLSSSDADIVSEAGEYRYPRWLANAKIRWKHNAWMASLGANYTHSYKDDPTVRTLETVGLDADAEVEINAWTVLNLSVSYDIGDDSYLQLNIDNLTDREPPRVLGSSANVDHVNHDSMGRYMTLRYNHSF